MERNELVQAIADAEKEAGVWMLEARGVIGEQKSSRRDVVTEYDRKVQNFLTERLSALLPEARFFCEEQDRKDDILAPQLFIIDPIDGTMNFVHGFGHSCISVGYAERGEMQAAAVYNPYSGELFTAVRGEGARCNGKPIRVDEAPLAESVVCFGTTPYEADLVPRCFALAQKAFFASLDVRRGGSAELDLCTVGAGRAGLYFELSLSAWDYAAGMLIVREAGGVCRNLDGRELALSAQHASVVAGSRAAVGEFLRLAAE